MLLKSEQILKTQIFQILVLLVSFVAASSESIAETPRADIVGQIVAISGSGGRVMLQHQQESPISARLYQPLYYGDVVRVLGSDLVATLEFAGNDNQITLTAQSGDYRVTATPGRTMSPGSFRRFVRAWGAVFSPPVLPQATATTPRSFSTRDSSTASPPRIAVSPFLPSTEQDIRGRPQDLTVVWLGSPTDVYLTTDTGVEVAHVPPAEPGFAVVHCPTLGPGRYRIRIGDNLLIPVDAIDADPPHLDDAEFAGEAADVLQNVESQKLQAVSDLRMLSRHNYLALAVLRWVRTGQTDH